MSDRKQIMINTKDFQISNKTRKKTPSDKKDGIKVRQESKKAKDTLKKRSILRMIRQHQHETQKDMFQSKKPEVSHTATDTFLNEFEKSKQYFENLAKEIPQQKSNNLTLKNYNSFTDEHVNMQFPMEEAVLTPMINTNAVTIQSKQPVPTYSSMKHGSMPTYRNWARTQKNIPETSIPPIEELVPLIQNKNVIENANKISEMKQTMDRLQAIKTNNVYRNMKRKKISRRTYKVGKSKVFPRISVLVSNRTIRNNITTKKQLLQQVPLPEVKKFLIKKGFIKIGTSAPNDVLRKMYEDVTLICGEVQNHNPDNLLYNYMNGANE